MFSFITQLIFICRCSQLISELATVREEESSLIQTVGDRNKELEVSKMIHGAGKHYYYECSCLFTVQNANNSTCTKNM